MMDTVFVALLLLAVVRATARGRCVAVTLLIVGLFLLALAATVDWHMRPESLHWAQAMREQFQSFDSARLVYLATLVMLLIGYATYLSHIGASRIFIAWGLKLLGHIQGSSIYLGNFQGFH